MPAPKPETFFIGGMEFMLDVHHNRADVVHPILFNDDPQDAARITTALQMVSQTLGQKVKFQATPHADKTSYALPSEISMGGRQHRENPLPLMQLKDLRDALGAVARAYPDAESLDERIRMDDLIARGADEGKKTTAAAREVQPYLDTALRVLSENGITVPQTVQDEMRNEMIATHIDKSQQR